MAVTWRLPKGTTWRQKLEEKHLNHGKVVPVPPRIAEAVRDRDDGDPQAARCGRHYAKRSEGGADHRVADP
jgi:hypothetical protein